MILLVLGLSNAHGQTIGFQTAANSLVWQFSFYKRQTLIYLGHFQKVRSLNRIKPSAVHFQSVVNSSTCVSSPMALRAEESLRFKSVNPTSPLSIQQSFLAALKENPKNKRKKMQWCKETAVTEKKTLWMQLASLLLKIKNGDKGEKRRWKSWFLGKWRREERIGKSCKRTSWAVFLFISLMCVLDVDALSQQVHFDLSVKYECMFVNMFRDSRVCMGVCARACVSTAGRRGGSTAGRRCARQSASPPGTGWWPSLSGRQYATSR